ncbi:MAG: YegS/Rv2252/BmrU family lipid kinase [Clostridiaceae bacterium]|jgi:diacylglycerol kinase (ATP)|nr:YegS/Rv2252/BmrU family lipid kinase [Clostridiaceae bacterium]HZJ90370.1 YegS/Rv2252/BmrU family lipid kinase [Oscillospiraceae bacterium]
MTKVLMIVNPFAGRHSTSKPWLELEQELVQLGVDVTLRETGQSYDATLIAAAEGSAYDFVCACGGDGTLSEVVSGLMHLEERPFLAFLPTGTTCDMAKSFDLPSEPHLVAETMLYGPSFAIDIGAISGSQVYLRQDLPDGVAPAEADRLPHHFTYVSSFGAFSETSYATPHNLKKSLGYFAYVLSGIKSLSTIESLRVRITRDSRITEESLIFGAVANSSSIGGVLEIDGARFDDGKFELLLVRTPENIIQLGPMLNSLINNNSDPLIIRELISDCEFEFLDDINSMTVDGEYGGTRKSWRFLNKPRSINLKVPELPHPPSHLDTVKDPRPKHSE